jgi:peptidoglycan/xylan/chitin deacetylase (PgdA/CDA1 family)
MNPSIVPILCYHRVCPKKDFGKYDALCVTPEAFRAQMKLLKALGYSSFSVQNLAAYLNLQKNLPSKSVVITFDDGYEDNYTHAYPILKETGMIGNIFLVTGRIGGANVWDQEKIALLNEAQIKEMHEGGVVFGSHTVNHVDLSQAPEDQIREELAASKKKLEEITSRTDVVLCYPYGRFNETVKRLARDAGYLCALAVDAGPVEKQGSDLFELRRMQIFPSTSLLGFWKKSQSWYPRWMQIQKKLKGE